MKLYAVAALPASEKDGPEGLIDTDNRPIQPLSKSRKHGTIVGRDRLIWRGFDLKHAQSRRVLVRVIADAHYHAMYRLQFPDGSVSDMVNLSRAKDAAIAAALRDLNSEVQETPAEGCRSTKSRRPLPTTPPGPATRAMPRGIKTRRKTSRSHSIRRSKGGS
jgi:hypothetical protein